MGNQQQEINKREINYKIETDAPNHIGCDPTTPNHNGYKLVEIRVTPFSALELSFNQIVVPQQNYQIHHTQNLMFESTNAPFIFSC